MQLSEAILLGSTQLRPFGGVLVSGDHGCALGMAYCAAASKPVSLHWTVVEEVWPWLGEPRQINLPCGCGTEASHFGAIAHIFDSHVCTDWEPGRIDIRGESWTLEQLCDWVRSVEPAEEAEPVRVPMEAETPIAGEGPVLLLVGKEDVEAQNGK